MKRALLALFIAGLAGCHTMSKGPSLGGDGAGEEVKTIVSNRSINISPSLQIPVEGLLLGAAVYWYVDPLAPNWQVAETRLADDRYRIALRRKPITSGGDGEAEALFKRRAEQLARDHGRGQYVVIEYTTAIESTLPFSYRTATGVVLLH